MRLTFLFLFATCWLSAQNYIVNGSFERLKPHKNTMEPMPQPCSYIQNPATFNAFVEAWNTFGVMTPDLLSWDSVSGCPPLPRPRTGSRMLGLIMYHPYQDARFGFDYHEMVQGTFAKPLEQGKNYRFSFWVWANDSLGIRHLQTVLGPKTPVKPVYCGNFGVYFSDAPANPHEDFRVSMYEFGIRPQINYAEIIETKNEWTKITLRFRADHPYKYFYFGNYDSDAVTPITMNADDRQRLDSINTDPGAAKYRQIRIAYYCFDDFAVVEDLAAPVSLEKSLLEKKQYIFSEAVLFDTGKSALKPAAQTELLQLVDFLQKNPGIRLNIAGHTDNVGNKTTNQNLSEMRAQAVCDFLTAHKIPGAQVIASGYGETRPVAPNDSDTNRQKNRRVECRVVE